MRTNRAQDGIEPPLSTRQALGAWAGVVLGGLALLLVLLFALKGFVDWVAGK